jgi:hypothetical protein
LHNKLVTGGEGVRSAFHLYRKIQQSKGKKGGGKKGKERRVAQGERRPKKGGSGSLNRLISYIIITNHTLLFVLKSTFLGAKWGL